MKEAGERKGFVRDFAADHAYAMLLTVFAYGMVIFTEIFGDSNSLSKPGLIVSFAGLGAVCDILKRNDVKKPIELGSSSKINKNLDSK